MAPLKKESKKATSAGRSVSEKHRKNEKTKTNAALTQDAYKKQETAPESRKLTKASIPKNIKIPTSWAQRAEPEDDKIRWGPELPTPAQIGQLHGRGEGRNLTSWRGNRLMERLLVTIDAEAKSAGIELPWAKIAHQLNPGMGPQAVQQFMDRTYNGLLNEGYLVPPPFRKHQSFAAEIRGFARDDEAEDGVRPVPYWEDFKNPPAPKKGSKRGESTASKNEDFCNEDQLEAQNLSLSGTSASPDANFMNAVNLGDTKSTVPTATPAANMYLPAANNGFTQPAQFGSYMPIWNNDYAVGGALGNGYYATQSYPLGSAPSPTSSLSTYNSDYAVTGGSNNGYYPTRQSSLDRMSSLASSACSQVQDSATGRNENGPGEAQQFSLDELYIQQLANDFVDMSPEEMEIFMGPSF